MDAIETARRIVALQNRISRRITNSERLELISEQRRLWDDRFPFVPFETIRAVAY